MNFRTSTGFESVTSQYRCDVGSRSFLGSNVLVRNESMNEMIYEMNHILNCRYEKSLRSSKGGPSGRRLSPVSVA